MLIHRSCNSGVCIASVGIPFAGSMSEVPHIKARTILVSDKHRHVINLARVTRDDALRAQLIRGLRRQLFHPDELADFDLRVTRLPATDETPQGSYRLDLTDRTPGGTGPVRASRSSQGRCRPPASRVPRSGPRRP